MRHNTKGAKEKLSQKGMGSMGWQKGARSQLVVRDDHDVPDQYVVSHTKHQYSPEGPPLVYQFNEVNKRGIVEWVGVSEVSQEELNDGKPDKDRRTKLKDAMEWLKEQLTDRDEVSAAWLFEAAEGRGFQKRLIQRAGASLKVNKTIDHKGGTGVTSMWSL
jgi:hypothetical protein